MRPLAVRVPLPGSTPAAAACLHLRGDERPVALVGEWADVTAILASAPVRVAAAEEDPLAVPAALPAVRRAPGAAGARVGGGWLGVLGFPLARMVERVPPPPPRPVPRPQAALAFYDHVVVRDGRGRWWFEALVTPARAVALARRLALWRHRLAAPPPEPRRYDAGPLRVAPPGAAGHRAAVAEARERIAAGEFFQVNLCLRLDGEWRAGDPLDLFARGVGALAPRHAAFVGTPGGAVASLSPERFLRRRGREVVTEPIKGTGADPAALAASAKDRAENVMIADLMRNDLGRVCAYGSVRVEALAEVRPGPGVWHLVSTVAGTLRPGATDADLLRATFPPGSCTGAPKVQAMRVLHELESSGREAYTGAIGIASPVAGLDLNVAIRTFEVACGRLWFGAGGGIVFDSDPDAELGEALAKAAAPAAATGLRVDAGAGAREEPPPPAAPAALAGGRERPDPQAGLLETVRAERGAPVALEAHLDRLRSSAAALGWAAPRVPAVGRVAGDRLRLVARPDGHVQAAAPPPGSESPRPPAEDVVLRAFALPGGLGAHKWADRRLVEALGAAILLDADGAVLEATYATVVSADGRTPPADGRLLPGVTRARALASGLVREAPLRLDDLADGVVLLSAVRGPHLARLSGGPPPGKAARGLCERLRATTFLPTGAEAPAVRHTD